MAEGRSRDQWSRTAQVLALIATAWNDKGTVFKAADFDPYQREDQPPVKLSKKASIKLIGQVYG